MAQHDLPAGRTLHVVAQDDLRLLEAKDGSKDILARSELCSTPGGNKVHICMQHTALQLYNMLQQRPQPNAPRRMAAALCDGCATLCGRVMGSSILLLSRGAAWRIAYVVASTPVCVGRRCAVHVARLK